MRPDRSVRLVRLQLGDAIFPGEPPKSARDVGNAHILQIGPTSSKCTVLKPHARSIGCTWGQLLRTLLQVRPNPVGPTSLQLIFCVRWPSKALAKCVCLSGTLLVRISAPPAKLRPFLGAAETPDSVSTVISNVFFLCWGAVIPIFGPGLRPTSMPDTPRTKLCTLSLAQFGRKLEPSGPSSEQVRQVGQCSVQLKAKDSQVYAHRMPSASVGPNTSAPFLSIHFSGCAWFSL